LLLGYLSVELKLLGLEREGSNIDGGLGKTREDSLSTDVEHYEVIMIMYIMSKI
jgi:hypothetical protein